MDYYIIIHNNTQYSITDLFFWKKDQDNRMPPTKGKAITKECVRCYLLKKEVQHLEALVRRLERTEKRLRLLMPIKKERESVACQTIDEEDHDNNDKRWTDTGTLIDEDHDNNDEDRIDRIDTIESTVWIPWSTVENDTTPDIYFDMDYGVHNHFMGVGGTDPSLYVDLEDGSRRFSLARLREKIRTLPFPYTDAEIQEQASWCSLFYFLEKREPFVRRVMIDQSYALRTDDDIFTRWRIQRVVHFEFC